MRCSVSVKSAGLDPTGTANNVLGFVVIDWPLPWPAHTEDIEALAPVIDRAADLGVRVQLSHHIDAHVQPSRVLLARRDVGPFQAYAVQGWRLDARSDELDRAAREQALVALALDALEGRGTPDPDLRPPDVLVCTHGKRDVCCGSFGTRLANDFSAARPDLEVWRTSHLGGHRFAPTALTLPDGNVWAYLDVDLLSGIVDRSLDPADAARHYRGCSATRPEAQLAERSALLAEGWSVLAATRDTGAEPLDGGGHAVWCEVRANAGHATRYEGRVTVNREIHLPDCGSIDAVKPYRDLRIDDVAVTELV